MRYQLRAVVKAAVPIVVVVDLPAAEYAESNPNPSSPAHEKLLEKKYSPPNIARKPKSLSVEAPLDSDDPL